jgi:N-acetylmuramoyl-L-alanine amidase
MGAVGIAQSQTSAWTAALAARARFEAEPPGTHTPREYSDVMNQFRAIYHEHPGDSHAARAVEQVAQLLAEQGQEFRDKKSLHDAVGQYEFLAKAYPGGRIAAAALNDAAGLLGPADTREKHMIEEILAEEYPDSPPAKAVKQDDEASVADPQGTRDSVSADKAANRKVPDEPQEHEPIRRVTSAPAEVEQTGPLSEVTGIRHWSTPSYTRVAIDLSVDPAEDVKYEAARVEDPDRIFFDLHHSRLAPQLAGKSFHVTDDGFVTRIRAAQFSGNVTRVVLDVHGIAEYSAFLLPNPYRLIIDIHGKQNAPAGDVPATTAASANGAERPKAAAASAQDEPTEVSSLPPMPVTDGSAGFGLPAKATGKIRSKGRVAQPRVVIPSKSTAAVPVPNTITDTSNDTGTEVAAVSLQQGRVQATKRPTSKPVSSGISHEAVPAKKSAVDAEESPASEEIKRAGQRRAVPDDMHPERASAQGAEQVAPQPAAPAVPTLSGQTSLTRALGLKIGRIVIDAGHGGHDSGTLGAGVIEEKDVVLDVALRLGKLLHDRLGAEVVYTRADDTFVPLETRTAIANKAQADLFISVHANSSADESARGVEVYYLNFTSDSEAMRVASRENAVSTESVHELSDLVKKIALRDKIDESQELATDVDASLYAGLRRGNAGLKDRGVKKAPFVVLIGANMPSILAEISFVTNPQDAEKLENPAYRQRVAESLYRGIARYAEGINGGVPVTPKVRTVEQAQR